MTMVDARTLWCVLAEEKCDTKVPQTCPGLMVFARLVGAGSLEEALAELMTCDCEKAKKLMKSPADYSLGVEAGVACRNQRRGRGCDSVTVDEEALGKAPPETRANAEKVLELVRRAGLRLQKILWDAELLHISVHAGCGAFVVSCGPVKCSITDAEGVDVVLADNTLSVKCRRTPPYLTNDYKQYL